MQEDSKMPSAVELVERLARESERQKVEIERLEAENKELRRQLDELTKPTTPAG